MENRCFHCMKPIDGNHCPYCGKSNSDPSLMKDSLLAPGTLVAKRYQVGVALDRNGEGVSYLAYDESVQKRVRLREFSQVRFRIVTPTERQSRLIPETRFNTKR